MRTCSISECSKPHYGKGYCIAHYSRFRRTGYATVTTFAVGTKGTDKQHMKERFDSLWMPLSDTSCWAWIGDSNQAGHGRFEIQGVKRQAYHVAWELYRNKPVEPGLHAMHKCDNPWCVNPDHIAWGSQWDNMQDAKSKGRNPRGESHGGAKLTGEQVLYIRSSIAPTRELMKQFGVSKGRIQSLRRGQGWSCLEGGR